MDITTWAEYGALSDEQRSAYSPEDLEALKSSIADDETKLSQERDEKISKLEQEKENQKIRAEKAERAGKKEPDHKPEPKLDEKPTLTAKDVLFLTKEGITEEEDVDEIINFAGYRKISISEARKDKTLISILSDRAEERRIALATQTKGNRGTTKVSDDTLLSNLSRGEIPEPGSEEAEKLFWARRKKNE